MCQKICQIAKLTQYIQFVKNEQTRTNWPRKVRELILDSDSRAQGVKGYAFRVPGGQRVGFHGRRGSRGRPKRTQQVKVKGRSSGSQGVKG